MKIIHAKLLSTVIAALFYLIAGMVLIICYDKLRKMPDLYRDLHTYVQPGILGIGIGSFILASSMWLSAFLTFRLVSPSSPKLSGLDKEHLDLLRLQDVQEPMTKEEKQAFIDQSGSYIKEANEKVRMETPPEKAHPAKAVSQNQIEREVILTAVPDEAMAKILDILRMSRTGQFQFPEKPEKLEKAKNGWENARYNEIFVVPQQWENLNIDWNSKDLGQLVEKLKIDQMGEFPL